ncbi:MAG: hypothetical protein GVY04_21765 [Cyanobacteria bacterium]|nr:hypothetical protein [Cyanobacteria bacterium GSL.Bin1]
MAIPNLLEELVSITLDTIEKRRKGLDDLRDLEEIANNNWLIPTGRLAEIIARSRY